MTVKASANPIGVVLAAALAVVLASCAERTKAVPTEAESPSTWQAQCLLDMAKSIDAEVAALKAKYPPDRVDDWDVAIELNDGEAVVSFRSNGKISIRGGGSEHLFSCAEKKLTFVQGYR